ncbi:DUF6415 family natural product biosynthesis protein (plasmid) [Streptomyces sp. NBC_01220]|uniref:DUF6415 family natural product biosynthesis protein n=1 Tax=Streptomyces sp. NBC_01220 TaxID=2903781 RepID=UPI00352ED1F0|nr:DUF6415 family natural product biosynthesis protein [Streptomyces sp. NBC_01220]
MSAVDARQIRRTYTAALAGPRTGTLSPAAAEERARLAGLLYGQLQHLVPVVEAELPRIDSRFSQSAAQYVLTEARAVLYDLDAPSGGDTRPAKTVFDLATLARSLLVLHEYAA